MMTESLSVVIIPYYDAFVPKNEFTVEGVRVMVAVQFIGDLMYVVQTHTLYFGEESIDKRELGGYSDFL